MTEGEIILVIPCVTILIFIDYNLFEQHQRVFWLKSSRLSLLAHISTGTPELLTQT